MINLKDYGYLKEEYLYSFDKNGKIQEISYSEHNERGEDTKVVGMYKLPNTGECMTSVLKWPQRNNGKAEGFLNDVSDDMILDINNLGKVFKSENIVLYTYDNSKMKDDQGFSVDLGSIGKRDYTAYVFKDEALVYDKELKIGKIYPTYEGEILYKNGPDMILMMKDFGLITTSDVGDTRYITVSYTNNNELRIEAKITDQIQPLKYIITSYEEEMASDELNSTDVTYYNDNMVCTEMTDEKMLKSRSERLINDFGEVRADSIYALMMPENYDMFDYIGAAYAHDILHYDDRKRKVSFERYIYIVDDIKKHLELIDVLNRRTDIPMISEEE